MRRIASLAETYDVALAPHCPLGPIALAASMQVALVSPNCEFTLFPFFSSCHTPFPPLPCHFSVIFPLPVPRSSRVQMQKVLM